MRSESARLRTALPSVLLSLGAPIAAAGQDCQVDDARDHADWHAAYREESRLRSEISDRARQAGLGEEVHGWVFVLPDEDELVLVDTNLPEPVQQALPGLLAKYFASPAIEGESLSLELHAPEIPLWPDSTKTCLPVLKNRSALRAVIETIAEFWASEAAAFHRHSVILLLYLDHSGRVAHAVVDIGSGQRSWDQEIEKLRHLFRYRPARRNGVPTAVWVRQEIDVQVDETM